MLRKMTVKDLKEFYIQNYSQRICLSKRDSY